LISRDNSTIESFDLTGLFTALAEDDFNRAADLPKGFTGESPRAVAMLAVARTVLSKKARQLAGYPAPGDSIDVSENALYYTFSAIAQALTRAIALWAAFVLCRLQILAAALDANLIREQIEYFLIFKSPLTCPLK
jgi:hypothetical protein